MRHFPAYLRTSDRVDWLLAGRTDLGIAVSPYDPWDEWRSRGDDGSRRPLRTAILAASPHNTQPWLFELSGSSVAVNADRARHLGAFDPFRREMHLGVGCAIENLVRAARR